MATVPVNGKQSSVAITACVMYVGIGSAFVEAIAGVSRSGASGEGVMKGPRESKKIVQSIFGQPARQVKRGR
jgi:hypothetical protein